MMKILVHRARHELFFHLPVRSSRTFFACNNEIHEFPSIEFCSSDKREAIYWRGDKAFPPHGLLAFALGIKSGIRDTEYVITHRIQPFSGQASSLREQ